MPAPDDQVTVSGDAASSNWRVARLSIQGCVRGEAVVGLARIAGALVWLMLIRPEDRSRDAGDRQAVCGWSSARWRSA